MNGDRIVERAAGADGRAALTTGPARESGRAEPSLVERSRDTIEEEQA